MTGSHEFITREPRQQENTAKAWTRQFALVAPHVVPHVVPHMDMGQSQWIQLKFLDYSTQERASGLLLSFLTWLLCRNPGATVI